MKFNSYYEDIALFLEKSDEQMNILQAVGNVLLGEVKAEDIPFIKEFKCVKDFLESPMNDASELSLKKVFAAIIMIANEKEILSFKIPESAEEVASMVDNGLTRIKVAYKEQMGDIDVYEAADMLVDRAAARTIAIVEYALGEGLPIVTETLANLAKRNQYTAPLAPFIETVLPYVAEPLKNVVVNGIKIMAEKSKSIIHKAIGKSTDVVTTTINKLSGKKIQTQTI